MELSVWVKWWRRVGEGELRALVMSDWDPIGVSDSPEAADEYDAYLGRIARRLRDGVTSEELAAFLSSLSEEHIGVEPAADGGDLATARHMREWYDASTARFAGTS